MVKRNRTTQHTLILQNTTQNILYLATRTSLETGCERRSFGRVSSFCSTSGTRRVTVKLYTRTSCYIEIVLDISIHKEEQITESSCPAESRFFCIFFLNF